MNYMRYTCDNITLHAGAVMPDLLILIRKGGVLMKARSFFKWLSIVLAGVILLISIGFLLLPKEPREIMEFDDPYRTERTLAQSDHYMASTGTPWATETALRIMGEGGNAYDAAMAAMLSLNVTFNQAASFPSVAPILMYNASTGEVNSYIGAGKAPEKATVEYFLKHNMKNVPKYKLVGQLLPASVDVLVSVMKEYGTMSFADLAEDAIRLARDGFPIHGQMLADMDLSFVERLGLTFLMPYNSQVYFHGSWWNPLHQNERLVLTDLANTLQELCNAEQAVLDSGGTREEGLDAVRSYFYEGPIAETIADYHAQKGGLITYEDLASYEGGWESPLHGTYNEYTVYSNQTWNQGAVVPMVLQMLEGIDLKKMGHNSPEYIHTVLQAIELAMADREAYFGDPAFVDVPTDGLLSKEYAAVRREMMTPGKAFGQMPPAGDPWNYAAAGFAAESLMADAVVADNKDSNYTFGKDTSYITVVDSQGNAVSLTPSDFPESPMIPGTGLNLGTRMTQFYIDENHVNGLMPGKRPRITPNPSMVLKDGELFMSFGTPGGDSQTQAIVQVFLNVTVFGMDLQEAISAPRFLSLNWPDSFAPHEYCPGQISIEEPLYAEVAEDMKAMGYKVNQYRNWDNTFGSVCAIIRDPSSCHLYGAADPREVSWAEGA